MNRTVKNIIPFVFTFWAAGCAATTAPVAKGQAALSAKVIAEPNPQMKPTSSGLDSYGGAGSAPRQLTPVDYSHLSGIVVWVARTDSAEPVASAQQVIPIRDRSTDEDLEVQGVSIGAKVVLENKTRKPQALYSVSKGNEFDLGSIASGQRSELTLRGPGLIEVLSESSDQPVALLYAVASPWVRTTAANKPVEFTNLPPGKYEVSCWTMRLPGSKTEINLPADVRSQVVLKVGVKQLQPR